MDAWSVDKRMVTQVGKYLNKEQKCGAEVLEFGFGMDD